MGNQEFRIKNVGMFILSRSRSTERKVTFGSFFNQK